MIKNLTEEELEALSDERLAKLALERMNDPNHRTLSDEEFWTKNLNDMEDKHVKVVIDKDNSVEIPAEIVKNLDLKEGQVFRTTIKDNIITLELDSKYQFKPAIEFSDESWESFDSLMDTDEEATDAVFVAINKLKTAGKQEDVAITVIDDIEYSILKIGNSIRLVFNWEDDVLCIRRIIIEE